MLKKSMKNINNKLSSVIMRHPLFHIRSLMFIRSGIVFPSTEDIQRTFIDFSNNNIISYVDYFPEANQIQCHIYSYPSLMSYYSRITNRFPGGLFQYVRMVSLYDEYPFQHEFFLQIQKSFPFLEDLTLINRKSQNRKQSDKSNNNNRHLSPIKYAYLTELAICNVHDDYIEQFLFHTKTYFPNNIFLYTNYESLQRVTHNFTRDATRINCAKINKLQLSGQTKSSNSTLQEYFPNAKICYS